MKTAAGRAAFAAIMVIALSGCDTKGRNLPLEVAKYQPPRLLLEERARIAPQPEMPARIVDVAGERWLPSATEFRLPERLAVPVGRAEGLDFFALAWDRPPYDRLLVFQQNPDWWRGPTPLPSPPSYWRDFLDVY